MYNRRVFFDGTLINMDLSLKNKRAVVAGSTAGIGKATAKELALLGAKVTLVARSRDKLEETLQDLPNQQQNHNYLVSDFSDPSELEKVYAEFIKTSDPVQILINNTGGPPGGKAIHAGLDEFRYAFNQHLICNQILTTLSVPGMKQSGYGRIINVISTSVKAPINGLGVSNTIRGAVGNWSKTLANELGEFNITVNNVLPGATMTDRLTSIIASKAEKEGTTYEEVKSKMESEIPMKRFASAEEVANAIAYLSSPAASYINGINVPVDGGRLPCL